MSTASEQVQEFKVIGTRPVRHDGVEKVIGRAKYGADYSLPEMLWAKVLRSPHAHARIKSINTDKALKHPGVKAVITYKDLPPQPDVGYRYSGSMPYNQHHLIENLIAKDKVLYHGHGVAMVAATSPHVAEEALDLIEVEYEVLPPVLDVMDAMKPDAPILRDDVKDEDGQALQRRPPYPLRSRRPREGLQGSRLHRRARVSHRDRASGLYRTAQRPGLLPARRQSGGLLLDAGDVRRPLDVRGDGGHGGQRYQGGTGGDWRRFRRQADGLLRAAGAGACPRSPGIRSRW